MTRSPTLLRILAGLLAVYLAAPFVAWLAQMGAADWGGADLPGLTRAAAVSVVSATLATGLVALGGIPLGYVLARGKSRRLGVLGFVVQLPLALPPLASGVLLLFLLGYASPIGQLTHGMLTDSFAGIVLAEMFVAAPFLIVAARSAFAGADLLLEDVAASLGHGPGAVFRRVSLPLAWRGILAGLLLAWLRAFGEFGATVMVAYHPYSLPIFTYVAFGSQGLPAMLPVLLPTIATAVAVMVLSEAVLRPKERGVVPAEPRAPPLPSPLLPPRMATGSELVLALHCRLEGFELAVNWQTSARRLAILGASGSGKSMSLRLIAGLGETRGSHVQFAGRDIGCLPPECRGVAYVPQNYGLLPHLPVAEQIRFAADFDPTQVLYWTTRLGLGGLDGRKPDELSLGQQQRVALVRALSRRAPGLVLLDEPFSALDTLLRVGLRREMLALQREMNATTILVTHDPNEALLLADEVMLLDAGKVLQVGRVSDVFSWPVSETAARLLGAEMIGYGHVTDSGTIDIGGHVELQVAGSRWAAGTPVGWAVRPHQLRLSHDSTYSATVLERLPVRDGQRQVTVQLGDTVLTLLTDPACPPEGSCGAWIDPQALQVWPDNNEGRL